METLSIRKTHKYVGTYRHMDEWEDIGAVEDMGGRLLSTDDEDPCEYTTRERIVRVRCDEVQPQERIVQAIRDTYSAHGCAHEYDCCGCWSHHVDEVEPLANGVYRFTVASSRNY